MDNITKYIDCNGTIFYYKNAEYHREDGPAIEYVDGVKIWCYNGAILVGITTQQEFEKWWKLKYFM